ncbi:hypothetical protein Aeqsu_3235 [Aequorivita sublithincola DSM 14238]|uniref:DUF2281 domain-containing protein n=1 Tax=Aequorivita sublithincola (strain DSM 14238 / LMG 21431 / ACAM 643 / 9-3) TaxID=746697 RepID=I3Z095_AEQSU|nr:hypothetical protein [Aequorivita sublithincola]AFL82663.1 hypothetical protein Aeqsu_3235 [Aequorivita sublithincola DSM 14238]
MNIDTLKIELIDWITQLKDQYSIGKVLILKKKLSTKKREQNSKIFGSGKHLVEYIADDFNGPLDAFKKYQK